MISLNDTIDKIISNSYRDIPVSSFNNSLYSLLSTRYFIQDPNGNLTNDGTNTYEYDYENRLTSAICPLTSVSYEYDGFGRRISKTVDGETTYFIYDGDQVIEERDALGNLSAQYVYGSGIDEVLTMNRDNQTYYYFYDGLGSVTDITDSSGEVVESYQYDVYGQLSQLSSIGNPYYFTGRRLDEETGLYYYRARYYSPSIGRFISRDPYTWGPDDIRNINLYYYDKITLSLILESLGVNSNIAEELTDAIKIYQKALILTGLNNPKLMHNYLYALNNPVNFTDPSGKDPATFIFLIKVTLIVGGLTITAFKFYKFYQKAKDAGEALDRMNRAIDTGDIGSAQEFYEEYREEFYEAYRQGVEAAAGCPGTSTNP